MKEQRPNPADERQTMRYLTYEASLGHFDKRPLALAILRYLVTNAWRTYPNKENADIGMVFRGKSRYATIAQETAMSYSTVQRQIEWLTRERWLDVRSSRDQNGHLGPYQILLLVDAVSHEDRAKWRTIQQDVARSLEVTEATRDRSERQLGHRSL